VPLVLIKETPAAEDYKFNRVMYYQMNLYDTSLSDNAYWTNITRWYKLYHLVMFVQNLALLDFVRVCVLVGVHICPS